MTGPPDVSRPWVWLVSLIGGVALLFGGAALQDIFRGERDDAEAALSSRRKALEQYARVSLDRRLDRRLSDARSRIEAALESPLLPGDGLLYVQAGRQRLPRIVSYKEGDETPARELHEAIERQTVTGEGPWGERVALYEGLRAALDAGDPEAVASNVRAFLNHQSRYVVNLTKDLPLRVAYLEAFINESTPDRSLVKALLREGLRGSQGRRLVGLQPLLLDNRERLTRPDFMFFAEKLSKMSGRARVVHDDFDAARDEAGGQAVAVPEQLEEPALIAEGRWYAAPVEPTEIHGVSVDLPSLLEAIAVEMRESGLIGPTDRLQTGPLRPVMSISDVPIEAHSVALEAAGTQARKLFVLKTAIVVALGVLVAGVAILSFLLVRRRHRLLESKASFVATVSHELRTPIASLRLMGETLERRLEGVEAAKDFPRRIVAEADRLSFLVENILSFNRLDRGRVAVNRETLSVGELAEQVLGDARAATKKTVELDVVDGSDIALTVDPELVRLLLSNLVHNSCKYNDREVVEIRVRARAEGDRTLIRVSDNGRGIAESEWEAIFTEFVRAESSGKQSGFGLGLALGRRIMNLHDGSIRVAESSGAGTTFELVFPRLEGTRA